MLASAANALALATLPTGAHGATTPTDIGEMKPHINFSLEGKVALVTGAARGIGRATGTK